MTGANSGRSDGIDARNRRALMLGLAALVGMLGYTRVVKPAWAGLAEQRQALAEQRTLFARERALVAASSSFPQRQREADQILTGARTRLFEGDSVAATAALTAYVSQMATATGVRLTTIEARAPTTEHALVRLRADVRGEGSWRQVLAFVRLLEVSSQLIDVSSIRLDRGPRGGPLGGDQVSLSASVAGYTRGGP